jgi:hypothetical protein
VLKNVQIFDTQLSFVSKYDSSLSRKFGVKILGKEVLAPGFRVLHISDGISQQFGKDFFASQLE